MLRLLALAALFFSLPAHAVTIDWAEVGNPGNACDAQLQGCFGSVPYSYFISKYEVTNAQYAEFLNAVAQGDPNGLYDTRMGNPAYPTVGGVARTGSAGSYTYSAIPGRENMPVNFATFYDALRFTNWLNNGQPVGPQSNATTEDGAYMITAAGIAANSITRNPGAITFLPSENEWYKAAYYDGTLGSYFAYPYGSDSVPSCGSPQPIANLANCMNANGGVTNVGAYAAASSPYGTFDQGGNLQEWTETGALSQTRIVRGGAWAEYQSAKPHPAAMRSSRRHQQVNTMVSESRVLSPSPAQPCS